MSWYYLSNYINVRILSNRYSIILQPILNSGITSLDENHRKTFLYNVTEHCRVWVIANKWHFFWPTLVNFHPSLSTYAHKNTSHQTQMHISTKFLHGRDYKSLKCNQWQDWQWNSGTAGVRIKVCYYPKRKQLLEAKSNRRGWGSGYIE